MTDRSSRSTPSARLDADSGDRPPGATVARRRLGTRQLPRASGRPARPSVPKGQATEPHVLVVDLGPALRDSLVQGLTSAGMLATAIAASDDLHAHVRRLQPQLVLLGLGGQPRAAIGRCAALRAGGEQVPVILVAALHDEDECVHGLEAGADDYVVLPLSGRELLARCHAALRRAPHPLHAPADLPPVRIGDSVFDPARRRISRGGGERQLTPLEYAILAELLQHPAQPVSRQRLLEVSHASGRAPLARSIDTAVMRLRRLVEPEPSHPLYLQTLHGRGYMFLPTGRPIG